MQDEFNAALATLASRDGPEAPRILKIHLTGDDGPFGATAVRGAGQQVTVRYLQEAPLWKTSYRAVRDGSRVHLQGWAHITNVDGIDWDDVSLSIVSARPVTYAIDVYTPEYVRRSAPAGGETIGVQSRAYAAAPEPRLERARETSRIVGCGTGGYRRSGRRNRIHLSRPCDGGRWNGGDDSHYQPWV